MHLLSAKMRSELLTVPQMARVAWAEAGLRTEPILIAKTTALATKYLILRERVVLSLIRVGPNHIGYALELDDDSATGALLWSLVESEGELRALKEIAAGARFHLALFDELLNNTAEASLTIDNVVGEAQSLLGRSVPVSSRQGAPAAACALDTAVRSGETVALPISGVAWIVLVTARFDSAANSLVYSVDDIDEGAQQEIAGLLLASSILGKFPAVRSPQVFKAGRQRELTDVLIGSHCANFLIESKTLAVLGRKVLPSRSKLRSDLIKRVEKAQDQLVGAVKSIRDENPITSLKGDLLPLNREATPHAIVLVPDLSLLANVTMFSGEFLYRTAQKIGGFFHILDLFELLRVVQASDVIAARSNSSQIEAFDLLLVDRAMRSFTAAAPGFEVVFKFEGDI